MKPLRFDDEVAFELVNGIIHGAGVNAGDASATRLEQTWGYADNAHTVPMRTDTVIDVASVTKVLATTTALLLARDEGLIDFDAPFHSYLPGYCAPLSQPISVRDLAMHISGFGQQKHYDAPTGEEIRRKLLSVPPPNPRGKFEYSCWNFQLLGMILEQITGQPLPEYCREKIFLPLGMHDTSLGRPITEEPLRLAQTCATDGPGQISDFIAFRLYRDGFSAGNAGAFSCAPDLEKFCRCLLHRGEYAPGKRLFSDSVFEAVMIPRCAGGPVRRSFGWIVADEWKPAGFSDQTIYHSGWSGQTVFLDLEKQFYAVVLTTRTLNEYERARAGRFRIIGSLFDAIRSSR